MYTPSPGPSDYFSPDRLKQAYEERNARTFESFLNQTDGKYGKGTTDAIRSGLSPKQPGDRAKVKASAQGQAKSAAGKAKAATNKAAAAAKRPEAKRPEPKGSKATGTAKSAAGRAKKPTK
jgi:hypothetical protein